MLEKRNAEHDEYVKLAAKVCRHGFVLQFYRGKNVVIDIEWTSHSQMGAIDLNTIQEAVDEVEGQGTCQKLIDMAWSVCPDGNCLIPLMATNEVLNGIMLVIVYISVLKNYFEGHHNLGLFGHSISILCIFTLFLFYV